MADSVKVTFAKLNGSNYVSWKYRMKMMLERDDIYDVIEEVKPEETDAGYAQWKKNDRKARAAISLFVEDSQLRFVKKAETAREMWENLQTYHEKATIGNQASMLQQLCGLNLGEGGDVEQHIDKIEDLYERLDNAGVEMSELLRIIMMLRSLPESYGSFVTSLENRPQADLTMDLVVGRLRDEYQKRCQQSGVKEEKALVTEAKPTEDERKCFFCHKKGHFKENCRKYLAKKNSGESSKSGPQAKQVKEQRAEQPTAAEKDVVCSTLCFVAGDVIAGAWTLDSGCTCHMTNDRDFFTEFNGDVVGDVMLADGATTKSAGCGSGTVFGLNGNGQRVAIALEYVLYVPALEGGLISVRKLAVKGFNVVFKANSCQITSAIGAVVAIGEIHGNQYKLKTAEGCMVAKGNHTEQCQHTWHRRFGHHSMDVMGMIDSKGLAEGIEIKECGEQIMCECCLKGKLILNPFLLVTERKSKQPLDLIHTDLCGPMENPTPSGNKYFLTMMDDYSRFSVVFLLTAKSEAAGKLKEFVRWAETMYGRKPRVVRSDGGEEYVGHELQSFYKAEGIQAQFSTPYSPQCNGVAEMKNRALQEMANCMLLDAGLPKRYWGEAVLTAAYIQNRIPSRGIDRTPFELWTGVKPDVSRLRVFGCAAYVHIPDVKREKFETKAKKLIFLGYSGCHEGYRFLDVDTDMITISRDARFIELGNGSDQQEELVEPEAPVDPVCDAEEEAVEVLNREEQEAEEPEEESSVYDDADESDFLGFDDEPLKSEQRSTRGVLPQRYEDFYVGQVIHDKEPSDFGKAMDMPECKKAMSEEMDKQELNCTWELVSLPAGKKIFDTKGMFKLKKDKTGKVVEHKALIVAQGYMQTFGVDYLEVFAPVAQETSLWAMLAVAGKNKVFKPGDSWELAGYFDSDNAAVWLRRPLGELDDQSSATRIFKENQRCLCFAKTERVCGRAKHIDTSSSKGGGADLLPVQRHDPDALTMPLGPSLLKKLVGGLDY